MLRERYFELLDRFEQARILVFGDFILDEFLFGEISRVSREAPVLILRYQRTDRRPGGGANTVANVCALSATVIPVGMVGNDGWAEQLLALWPESVSRDFITRNDRLQTTRKARIVAGSFHSYQQQVVRMDYEIPFRLLPHEEDCLRRNLDSALSDCNAVILSDYSIGCVSEGLRRHVVASCRRLGLPVIVDSRDDPGGFPGVSAVTPNVSEIEAVLQTSFGNRLEELESSCARLLTRWQIEALLVTRGKLGMSLFEKDSCLHLPVYGSSEAVDVTGAGDTVAATFTTALAAGASFSEAARLANFAGGIVVMKKGTATVSVAELKRAVDEAGKADLIG